MRFWLSAKRLETVQSIQKDGWVEKGLRICGNRERAEGNEGGIEWRRDRHVRGRGDIGRQSELVSIVGDKAPQCGGIDKFPLLYKLARILTTSATRYERIPRASSLQLVESRRAERSCGMLHLENAMIKSTTKIFRQFPIYRNGGGDRVKALGGEIATEGYWVVCIDVLRELGEFFFFPFYCRWRKIFITFNNIYRFNYLLKNKFIWNYFLVKNENYYFLYIYLCERDWTRWHWILGEKKINKRRIFESYWKFFFFSSVECFWFSIEFRYIW